MSPILATILAAMGLAVAWAVFMGVLDWRMARACSKKWKEAKDRDHLRQLDRIRREARERESNL